MDDPTAKMDALMNEMTFAIILIIIISIGMVAYLWYWKTHIWNNTKDEIQELYDGYHDVLTGGHMDRDLLVLEKDLGGSTYRMIQSSESFPDTIKDGDFHLFLQDTKGRKMKLEGTARISESPIPRTVAVDILSVKGLSGMLNVYTPLREDAESIATKASDGSEPCGHSHSIDRIWFDFAHYHHSDRDPEGNYAAMVLYGPLLGVRNKNRKLDLKKKLDLFKFGCVALGGNDMRLCPEMGGIDITLTDLREFDMGNVKIGDFHILVNQLRV